MDIEALIHLLDHMTLGSAVAMIVFVAPFIYGAYKACVNIYNWISKRVKKEVAEEQHDESISSSISTLTDNVIGLQESVNELIRAQENLDNQLQTQVSNIEAKIDENEKKSNASDDKLREQMCSYETGMEEIRTWLQSIGSQQKLLIDSDKETIRAYITDAYFVALDKGSITYHQMENLESMYKQYLEENGDSFIEDIMTKLRKFPLAQSEP